MFYIVEFYNYKNEDTSTTKTIIISAYNVEIVEKWASYTKFSYEEFEIKEVKLKEITMGNVSKLKEDKEDKEELKKKLKLNKDRYEYTLKEWNNKYNDDRRSL